MEGNKEILRNLVTSQQSFVKEKGKSVNGIIKRVENIKSSIVLLIKQSESSAAHSCGSGTDK